MSYFPLNAIIGLEFWLYSIQVRAPECPVLVVGTRVDEVSYNNASIPEKALRKKYPQIRGFFAVSCKTKEGVQKFQEELIKVALSEPCILDV